MIDSVSIIISTFIASILFILGFILGERQSTSSIRQIVETVLQALKLQDHPNFKNATINPKTIQVEIGDGTTTLNR